MVDNTKQPQKNIFNAEQLGNSKLVGGYLPLPLANRMRLLSVYQQTTVQGILRELIESWSAETPSDEQVIGQLANRICAEWERRVETGEVKETKKSQKDYQQEITGMLRRRKVSDHHICMIVDRLKKQMEGHAGGDDV